MHLYNSTFEPFMSTAPPRTVGFTANICPISENRTGKTVCVRPKIETIDSVKTDVSFAIYEVFPFDYDFKTIDSNDLVSYDYYQGDNVLAAGQNRRVVRKGRRVRVRMHQTRP